MCPRFRFPMLVVVVEGLLVVISSRFIRSDHHGPVFGTLLDRNVVCHSLGATLESRLADASARAAIWKIYQRYRPIQNGTMHVLVHLYRGLAYRAAMWQCAQQDCLFPSTMWNGSRSVGGKFGIVGHRNHNIFAGGGLPIQKPCSS